MKAIPYSERIRLGERVPEEGQFAVMRDIPPFSAPDVCNLSVPAGPAPETLRAAVFNVEHGYRSREIVSFLKDCLALQNADVLFANETDDGTERSGNIDVSREIAERLGYNYAYALEFIELVNPNDRKGYEGNTLFSKWPIVRAEALHLPEGYNWYFDSQKRIGARVALFCELDVAGRRIGVVCTHLENRTVPASRAAQMQAILEKADAMFKGLPVLIGGDLNTNAFDYGEAEALRAFRRQQADGIVVDPSPFEPLFALAERAGYDYRTLNGEALPTRRRPTGDGVLYLHLDWIFGRGVTCVQNGTISTLLKDCGRAGERSSLYETPIAELSDHNAVWADIAF
ncbi:MAG: endonuclease/exonuclease/phosphatase family protein [Clostridia bacterium]|nr:endonuclease/exonuclease/phosphatase family protein [Clostridia bacterium]